jgi:hypothetical protein
VRRDQNLYSFILIASVLTVRASWSQSVPKPETPGHSQDRQLPSPETEAPALGRSGASPSASRASDGAATTETLSSTETEDSVSKAGVAGTFAPTPAPSAPDGTLTEAASRAPTSVGARSPVTLQEHLATPTLL